MKMKVSFVSLLCLLIVSLKCPCLPFISISIPPFSHTIAPDEKKSSNSLPHSSLSFPTQKVCDCAFFMPPLCQKKKEAFFPTSPSLFFSFFATTNSFFFLILDSFPRLIWQRKRIDSLSNSCKTIAQLVSNLCSYFSNPPYPLPLTPTPPSSTHPHPTLDSFPSSATASGPVCGANEFECGTRRCIPASRKVCWSDSGVHEGQLMHIAQCKQKQQRDSAIAR